MTDRAVNSTAWWATLPPEKCRKALDLVKRHGIGPDTCEVVAQELSIKAPSRSALGRFYQWAREQETVWTLEKAMADKTELEKILAGVGDINEAVMAGLSQLYLDALISRDPLSLKLYGEQLAMLMKGRKESQDIDIKLRRLKLLEDKVAQAKAALSAAGSTKGGITPETLKTIEEALNLL